MTPPAPRADVEQAIHRILFGQGVTSSMQAQLVEYVLTHAREAQRLQADLELREGELGSLDAYTRDLLATVARLRAALMHEVSRNHEHTEACAACQQSDAALTPPDPGPHPLDGFGPNLSI